MPNESSFKLAFIGSHGVGKTTRCYCVAAGLQVRDVSLDVGDEVARRCPLPINEETGVAAQSWILHTQLGEELVAGDRHPVVICDRSVLDNYVYLLLAAGRQPGLEPLIDYWVGTYDLLVHVPIVARPPADGVRATDPSFQSAVDDRLVREVEQRGLAVVRLSPDARSGWLDEVEELVWDSLRPPQLRLV